MIFRVHYPLITCDGKRDFDTREEAEKFARSRRDIISEYQTMHSWRMVRVEEIQSAMANDKS